LYPRQFFSFDAESAQTEAAEIDMEEASNGEAPVLPDVPTNEPAEVGQPDAKKRKVADEDSTTVEKTE
jgi:hypothetical protein